PSLLRPLLTPAPYPHARALPSPLSAAPFPLLSPSCPLLSSPADLSSLCSSRPPSMRPSPVVVRSGGRATSGGGKRGSVPGGTTCICSGGAAQRWGSGLRVSERLAGGRHGGKAAAGERAGARSERPRRLLRSHRCWAWLRAPWAELATSAFQVAEESEHKWLLQKDNTHGWSNTWRFISSSTTTCFWFGD
ncbi:unnamed protein product, partial [Urochloa humidicola]